MALRASLGALRRVSAFVVAPLVERNAFVLPSARRALAAPPVWTPRAGGMSTVSDSQQKEKPEQQKEKPEQQKEKLEQPKEKPEPQKGKPEEKKEKPKEQKGKPEQLKETSEQLKETPEPQKEKAGQQQEPSKITFDIVKVVSTVVAVLVSVAYVMWNYPRSEDVPDSVLETFESGGKPGWDSDFKKVDATADIKRPDVEKKLEEFFYPTPAGDLSASYVLIVGEHGTGKSTAVRRVVREREGINGTIYVNVPDDIRFFGGVVASAMGMPDTVVDIKSGVIRRINQETKEVRELPLSEEPSATWARASLVIRGAASNFYDKHKRPAVLIIDAAERLAKKNPAFFEQLQDFAKDRTDEGSLRVVFVSSDGSVLEQFQSRSAWSRAIDPFEVGDISDKAAVEFLTRKGVAEKQAEEAVRDITGGRFELLRKFVESWAAKGNESTRQELFKATRESLRLGGFDPTHKFFRALVSQKRIDIDPARNMWGDKHIASLRALLEKNIIAAHPDLTLTFHSRHVESFFKQEVLGSKRWWWWGSRRAAPSAPPAVPRSSSSGPDSATEGKVGGVEERRT